MVDLYTLWRRPIRPARLLGTFLVLSLPLTALAQSQNVGIGTTTPNAKAALDISATDKGLLIPRLTQAQRTAIVSPPDGLMIFQTDGTTGFWYCFGGAWVNIPNATTAGDNLGNHTATQKLDLAANKLVGNGGTSGISISNAGAVTADNGLTVPSGGASVTGTTNVNTTGTAATNLGTGASAGAVTVGRTGSTTTINGTTSTPALTTGTLQVTGGTPATGKVLTSNASGNATWTTPADPSATNELQTLSISGSTITLSNSGGAVTVPSSADNLGNHTATQDLDLATHKLVGNGGTSGISIASGGGVGIGTTTPTQLLDVNGGILARGYNTISNQGTYMQWNRSNGEGESWVLNQKGGGTANAGIRFGSVTAANVTTEWARFLDNGNLGIGTTSPAQKLDVNGGILVRANNAVSTQGAYLHWNRTGDGETWLLNQQGLGGSNTGIRFGEVTTGNVVTEWARFLDNGNLGIGTTAPTQKLDVAGTTRTTNLQVTSGAASGKVLTSDASGNATWQTPASGAADNLGNHTATQDLNLGTNALIGNGASISGVGVGVRADGGLNLGQNDPNLNVLLGYQAGPAITTGNDNLFVGY